jgi:acetyltransferase-like isoleucine patch superfamily enzyme
MLFKDVLFGYDVVIAKPVTTGKGSIIGANAFMTNDVEPYWVIDAKRIRTYNQSENT